MPSHQDASNIIGLGLYEAVSQLFPDLKDDAIYDFARSYSSHFKEQDNTPCEFFPGVEETLVELRDDGFLLTIATGKSRAGLDRVLAAKGMDLFFDGSRCADETLSKPDPLMLHQLLDEFSVSANEALMVGDTEFDLNMALRAGVPAIGVTYGAHSAARLMACSPLKCVDTFYEIKKYI